MGQGKWAIVGALALCCVTNHAVAAEPPAGGPFEVEQPAAASAEAKKQTALRVMQTGSYIGRSDAADRIEGQLREPLRTDLKFAETPLNSVMQIIADEYDIPIQFDKPALDAVAVSPDAQVTFNLRNVTLSSALDIIFREVPDVTYVVDNEVLLITTEDEAAKRLQVRVYRVDDLLQSDPHNELPLDGGDYDRLIDLVSTTIERDSWRANNTGEGTIEPFAPGMLVVSQTRRVHTQIDQLFRTLRTIREHVLADAAKSDEGNRLVTQGIPIVDESLAKDETARNLIRDVLMRSSDWKLDDEQLAVQVSLDVLPTRVVVRHKPAVVRQVEQTLRDLALTTPSTSSGGFSGGGPNAGAFQSNRGQSAASQREVAPGRRGGF